ncbi:MAG: aspartyl/glutamyl-tRNA amidotransferase subunit B [Betaproteobacteria bacterium RIFCSPLOWO2_12_FULL_63_13]|nr:MAG: aspartyl/glutamyl-tRNA amidotransferase subunit B [Betaproteobacteria bacterium RIFCSPLOWO2_12_FULL_63_13]
MAWETVIGLEIHAQLSTRSKIFSGASARFGAVPNAQACAVDIALPGVLPVANKGAVERAIRFGLAIGASINKRSVFARKNYFYPDLPKGYQISQFELPIVQGGSIAIVFRDGEKIVRLTRAHLEEDAGKSLHEDFHGMSGIDLNRAGTPLLEIVSEPDMHSAAEAVAYARAVHSLVRWIDICDGNMQEGSFRCDANVSVRRPGEPLGTRREIKNLNSFRFLQQAIEYEANWQIETLQEGGTIHQATVLFDPDSGQTRMMRSKEDAHDYRYFPDPDLPPLVISEQWIDEVKRSMPELPSQKFRKFTDDLALAPSTAAVLISDRSLAEYFETAVQGASPEVKRQSANWIAVSTNAKLNERGISITQAPVSPQQFRELMDRVVDGTISGKMAKDVDDAMWAGEGTAGEIIEKKGLKQISDSGELETIVDQVIAANPKSVEEYRAGRAKAFNALVGQAMKATRGRGNPAQINDILKKKLGG